MNKHYPDKKLQEVPPHRRYMKKQVSFDSPPPKQIANLDESDDTTDTTYQQPKRYSVVPANTKWNSLYHYQILSAGPDWILPREGGGDQAELGGGRPHSRHPRGKVMIRMMMIHCSLLVMIRWSLPSRAATDLAGRTNRQAGAFRTKQGTYS